MVKTLEQAIAEHPYGGRARDEVRPGL